MSTTVSHIFKIKLPATSIKYYLIPHWKLNQKKNPMISPTVYNCKPCATLTYLVASDHCIWNLMLFLTLINFFLLHSPKPWDTHSPMAAPNCVTWLIWLFPSPSIMPVSGTKLGYESLNRGRVEILTGAYQPTDAKQKNWWDTSRRQQIWGWGRKATRMHAVNCPCGTQSWIEKDFFASCEAQ